jgi:hypothetical protein
MKTFNFYLDTKITTWMRTDFEIEANSLEEAKQKAIEFHLSEETGGIPWEQNLDCQEILSVEENGGQSTEELFLTNTGEEIWNNSENSTLSVIDTLLNK